VRSRPGADAGSAPAPGEYLQAMTPPPAAGLRADGFAPEAVVLQIEPGRAIYGDAAAHLTTVRHVKRQAEPVERTWIETDTSEAFLADTVIESNAWTIVGGAAEGPLVEAAITGISCGWDVLAPPAPRTVPRPGALLAFLDTGAYQDACASNFNAMGRPATVLVSGREAHLIRRAETFEDLIARDVVPAHLG
jgi:diaminopimelate decarboxylase